MLAESRTGARIRQNTGHPLIATGAYETIAEPDTVGQPEFHRSDNSLLRYTDTYKQRISIVNRDYSGYRLVYDRKPLDMANQYEWILHETWRPALAKLPPPAGRVGSSESHWRTTNPLFPGSRQ